MIGASGLTTLAVPELLGLLREGALRPLPLPRGALWGEAQCIEFLDSLARGLPAGALVLARGAADAGRVTLGRLTVGAAARPDALWVVDGRQRLGALAEALREAAPGDPALALDLARGTVSAAPADDDRQGELPGLGVARALPLATLLDAGALLRWLRLHPQSDAAVERALGLAERLRSYRFPVYQLSMEDPDRVAAAFERANGERLDAVDRFSLRQNTGGGEAGAPSLRRATRALGELGFGVIDEDVVLRVLRALAGATSDDVEATPLLLRQSEAALRRAIVFLQVNAGVAHEALLPYALILVVLARFFHEYPRPQGPSREALRRWVWRGSLGLTLGANAGHHLNAIRPGDEEGSARRLLALAPGAPSPEVTRLERFHAAHARSRLQLCALASLCPCALDGSPLELSALFAHDPSPPLLVEADSPLASSAANRLLHPRLSTGLPRALLTASEAVLTSHAVSPAAVQALRDSDSVAFLEARAATLRALLDRTFTRQAEWGLA